jgi:branched-chain amino acid aminotransferase
MARGTHDALPDPRNADVLVYVNGEFLPRAEAKVSVFDSAFLVGDGVWEGLRLHNGRFAYLDRHLRRLERTAKGVHLELPMTRSEIRDLLYETVRRNDMHTDVHVRLMITRGEKKTPSQDPRLVVGVPTVVVTAEHKVADPEVTRGGITLFTSAIRRPPPDTLDQTWNCHSKIHEVVALIQALEAGADEALMLDTDGNVATCNATNFFIVSGGVVTTAAGACFLPGITRGLVLELCREHGIPSRETAFSVTEAYAAEESFVTGTFGGLTPVTAIDGRRIARAPGPVTERLLDLYRKAFEAAGEDS